MSFNFASKPPSDEEISSISQTLSMKLPDSAAVRERLACAAALLGALPTPPDQPSLVYEMGPGTPPAIILIGSGVVIGRQVEGPGCVPHCGQLSRRHFRVFPNGGYFAVEDLGSSNGTMIDGVDERIIRRYLRDGDFIIAGSMVFLFVNPLA